MQQEKIKNYTLTGSIHTLQVRSPDEVTETMQEVQDCIAASSREDKGQKVTTAVINPNKLMGDCFKFSEFSIAFETILTGAGIENYSIMRADLRLDSYDPEHYHLYSKLHKYLISALAVKYKVKNAYKTNNLFTQEQLSIAIKTIIFKQKTITAVKNQNSQKIIQKQQNHGWRSALHQGAGD